MKNLLFGIIFFCILYVFYIIYQNTYEIECINLKINSCDKVADYKIKNRDNNIHNKYNIKEYDHLNENIIIHNKFKNELINNQIEQNLKNKYIQEQITIKNKEFEDKINKNKDKVIIENLKLQIKNLKYENDSFKLLLKTDINNILNDLKNNKLETEDKNILISKITNSINLVNQELSKNSNRNYINSEEYRLYNIYDKLLNNKLELLNKKYKIYKKIF